VKVVVTVRISQGEKRISNTISRFVCFLFYKLAFACEQKVRNVYRRNPAAFDAVA
jgi:hypothetical protein